VHAQSSQQATAAVHGGTTFRTIVETVARDEDSIHYAACACMAITFALLQTLIKLSCPKAITAAVLPRPLLPLRSFACRSSTARQLTTACTTRGNMRIEFASTLARRPDGLVVPDQGHYFCCTTTNGQTPHSCSRTVLYSLKGAVVVVRFRLHLHTLAVASLA
jgi:hypothetical protein